MKTQQVTGSWRRTLLALALALVAPGACSDNNGTPTPDTSVTPAPDGPRPTSDGPAKAGDGPTSPDQTVVKPRTFTALTSGTSKNLNGVWGAAENDVYAVGQTGTILHWNGQAWSAATGVPNGFTYTLQTIWGAGASDIFAAGQLGIVIRFDGQQWKLMPSAQSDWRLMGMWGSDKNNIWAVGDGQVVVHYDGTAWKPCLSATSTCPLDGLSIFSAVWGSGPNDVWVVGDGNIQTNEAAAVFHYDGKGWKQHAHPAVPALLNGVWGTGPGELLTVGTFAADPHPGTSGGAIYKISGGSGWTLVDSGSDAYLRAIAGTGPNDAYIVGGEGTILRWDGKSWSKLTSGVTTTLRQIWISPKQDIFVVGDGGVILRSPAP